MLLYEDLGPGTWDLTFLQKSYSEYTKVEKPVLVTTSYEGLNDEEEFEMFPIVDNNVIVHIVIDSASLDNIENENKNFLTKISKMNLKQPHKQLSMQNWSGQ